MRPDLSTPRDSSPPATSRGLARGRTLVPLAVLSGMLAVGIPAWRAAPADAALPDLSVLPELTTVASATGAHGVRLAVDAPSLDHRVVGRVLGVATVPAEDASATHALALLPPGLAPSGWRDALPPPRFARTLPSGWTLRLWNRPLPPERLLAGGRVEDHFPAEQALWFLEEGVPVRQFGPASSVALARVVPAVPGTDAGADTAIFVRGQALWRAARKGGAGPDAAGPPAGARGPASHVLGGVAGGGTPRPKNRGAADTGNGAWATPQPLGIRAVDPALVRLEDGTWRLYAVTFAEGVGDPVASATTVRSWRSEDLRSFTEEPGVRLAGRGLLDPSVARRPDGTWEMWLTEGGRRLRRATSPDALLWTLDEAVVDTLDGATVPEIAPDGSWMIVQRRVADRSGLYLHVRAADDTWEAALPLEICGTGPARVVQAAPTAPRLLTSPVMHGSAALPTLRGELGWSDSRAPCGPPYAFPRPAPG